MKLERKVRLCSAAAAVLIAAIMAAIAGLIIFVLKGWYFLDFYEKSDLLKTKIPQGVG